MKTKSLLLVTAAVVALSASAMANSPIVRTTHTVVKGPDIVIYTDKNGAISKAEWLSYQSQRFDEMSFKNADGRIYDEKRRAVLKDDWMASQSQKFDDMDTQHVGKISRNEFDEQAQMGPTGESFEVSSSRPRSDNQAISTSDIPSGADGAAGWTGQ